MSNYDPKYHKKWRIERERGLKRTTPALKAQIHVQSLTVQGVSVRSIAEAAGTDASTISELNRGIKKSITHAREAKILAVTPEAIFERPNPEGFVLNIGGRRRIQALLYMGWRHKDMTEWFGFSSALVLSQVGNWISRRKHDAIKAAYDQHWNQQGPSAKTTRLAIKAGYAPPLAWDEDEIDDPEAIPAGVEETSSYGVTAETHVEEAEFLLAAGTAPAEIPARLGLSASGLEKSLHRAGRHDLVKKLNTSERIYERKTA